MYSKKRSMPMSQALKRFFNRKNADDDLCLAKLWDAWDTLFDAEISKLICPLGHIKETLILGADDAIVMQEFTYFSEHILERVNTFLDKPFFKKIRIELRRGRSPLNVKLLPPPPPKQPPIKPDGLGQIPCGMNEASPVTRAYVKYVRLFNPKASKGPNIRGDLSE